MKDSANLSPPTPVREPSSRALRPFFVCPVGGDVCQAGDHAYRGGDHVCRVGDHASSRSE